MAIKDYGTNPDQNRTVNGINIAEGCPPGNVNNAIRQVMADIKTMSNDIDAGTGIPAGASNKRGGYKAGTGLTVTNTDVLGVAFATNAEVQAGTVTNKSVTPAGLNSRTATATRTGLVELATNAEAQAGTDATRAVTPAGLASRTATTSRQGIVELATNAKALDGTDAIRALTPAGLSACFALSSGGEGYFISPRIRGGRRFILMWGSPDFAGRSSLSVTWPFPLAATPVIVATDLGSTRVIGVQTRSATGCVFTANDTSSGVFMYIATGQIN